MSRRTPPSDDFAGLDFPLIRCVGDLLAHQPGMPAFVLLPAALVPAVARMVEEMTEQTPCGDWARGLELMCCSFSEQDPVLLYSAMRQITRAAAILLENATEEAHQAVLRLQELAAAMAPLGDPAHVHTATVDRQNNAEAEEER